MAPTYITLAELKAYMQITEATRDTALTDALTAASRWIDTATGRRFYLDASVSSISHRTHARTFTAGTEFALIVPDIATSLGMVIGHTGVSTDASEGDGVRPITRLYADTPWPERAVTITAKFGWPAVPDEIKQATKILATRFFKRKDSPEGVAGAADWGAIRLSRRDPDVQALIDPYTLPGIA